jgi:AcrR family transcriptional regulator
MRPGLRDRKKDKTRTTLIRCAVELIKERGYEATTVDDIVERAEYSRSTFFRYFGSKEDVILGTPEERLRLLVDELEAGADPNSDAWALVREILTRHLVDLTAFAPELEAECMNIALTEPALLPGFASGLMQSETYIGDYFSRIRGRDPEGDYESRMMAVALVGVVRSTLQSRLSSQEEMIKALDRGFDMLEQGFSRTPDRGLRRILFPRKVKSIS